MRRAAALTMGAALACVPAPALAQIGFANLLEARLGKDPNDPRPGVPDNRTTLFEQFHLDYDHDSLQLGFRFEHYTASEDGTLGFSQFVQRYAAWHAGGLAMRVGHFHSLFGRGVVLRAFELPGVVREEQFRQFGDSRDLDGAHVRYRGGAVEVTALSGKPRRADDPPGTPRRGLVTGAQAAAALGRGLHLGGEYVRLDAEDGSRTAEVPGGFAQFALAPYLEAVGVDWMTLAAYVEHARASGLDPAAAVSPAVAPDAGRATYVAADVGLPALAGGLRAAASWEYKDYQNFALPGGVNEPPTLVREHSIVLLNRGTHVLEPAQEEGMQLECRLDWRRRAGLILNWSRAENADSRRFHELFGEISVHDGSVSVSVFVDAALDESALPPVLDRDAFGTLVALPIHGDHGLQLELARLTGARDLSPVDVEFEDRYASVGWTWAERVSLQFVHTSTDDPGDPGAGEPDPVSGAYARHEFNSLAARLRLGNHHDLVGFWGRRRGGTACTAGTCYLVPAFDGLSVQIMSRF